MQDPLSEFHGDWSKRRRTEDMHQDTVQNGQANNDQRQSNDAMEIDADDDPMGGIVPEQSPSKM